MTYNVFGGTLSLTQSINQLSAVALYTETDRLSADAISQCLLRDEHVSAGRSADYYVDACHHGLGWNKRRQLVALHFCSCYYYSYYMYLMSSISRCKKRIVGAETVT